MTEMRPEQYGAVAYNAYFESVGGKAVNGDELPIWDDLRRNRPRVATAWVRAADAVRVAELRAFAEFIDRGPEVRLLPSVFSQMTRERAGDEE